MAVLLVASAASAQLLDCPGSASRTSDTFHYHVSMYRPDTRGFFDVWGTNQFASQSACDRAREAQMKRNLAVVDYFKRERGETQYEPDRFGTCHADLSTDKTNPRFLTDAQRLTQIRGAEEIRQRVRERLLDANVATDSEVFRDVSLPPYAPPALLGGPKLPPMPQPGTVTQPTYVASDLRSTKAVEAVKAGSTIASLDLPLVDAVPGAAVPPDLVATVPPPPATTPVSTPPATASAPAAAVPETAASAPAAAASAPPAAQPAAAPAESRPADAGATAPQAVVAPPPSAETAAAKPAEPPAEEAAEAFIAYETQRIQNVLKASAVIADSDVKSKIYDSCMQRIQLLSNLRSLIEVSGSKSRLATMSRTVRTEDERLAFVSKLFGDDIRKHWAPADATDVILEAHPDTDNDVERVLRDSTGHYNDQQKRRALYSFLARSQPTEDQQLWLTTIADSFLQ